MSKASSVYVGATSAPSSSQQNVGVGASAYIGAGQRKDLSPPLLT